MENENKPKGNTERKPHDEQRRRTLEFQHFDLMKFKITKDGVDVTHHEKVNESFIQTTSGEYQPHPDLKAKMDELKLYMATRLGLLEGWDFSREYLKGDLDLLKLAIASHKETIDRCNVNGLTFLGEGETYGVAITGSIAVPKGGSVGMSVPKITFGSDKLGYEKEVQQICEQIKSEVYQYRFQAKKAQLDIETEAEKVEKPDLFLIPELQGKAKSKLGPVIEKKLKGKKPLFKDQVQDAEQMDTGSKPELI
jgi:hypothetical protein